MPGVRRGIGRFRNCVHASARCFLKAAAGYPGGLHTKWNGFRRAGHGHLADRTPISI
ncbi:hypothetical protein BN2475_160014 [Paraburkholderia ribeironis]|uniref:Uncharacterized protein n=1 Tax=Paraburkholderia ribeironis TaxID=1247936 RepID=A0A1N7RU48_9BURK|nr:hypothetical protein BN2475_160014 [Paraburkholderia ribeironis]